MTRKREYNYLLKRQKDLLEAVNEASVGARTTWLFYLALMAYFFIAIAGVTHQNLLLNTPVELPFFGIGIDVAHFFLVAPIVFLLIQLGMLVQHVALHRKVCRFSQKLSLIENIDLPDGEAYRIDDADWLRFQVSSYFYTQRYAGPLKRTTIHALLILMYQVSFLLLPVVLLLFFQAKFVPYHDEVITGWTRVYVIIGVTMLVGMRLITLSYESKTQRQNAQFRLMRAISLIVSCVVSVTAILASILIFTIPDSKIDCVTRLASGQLYRTAYNNPSEKPIEMSMLRFVFSPFKTLRKYDEQLALCRAGKTRSSAFPLTAYLSDRRFDPQSGRRINFFDRNLYVTDQEIVKTTIAITRRNGEDEVGIDNDSVSLRDRNLRYAILDRSIMKGADFTGADLQQASLRGTVLQGAEFRCDDQIRQQVIKTSGGQKKTGRAGYRKIDTKFIGCANLERANLEGADLTRAKLRGANFRSAKLQRANLTRVLAISTDFTQAELSFANFNNAHLPRAIFRYANLTEASMTNAKLRFAQFSGASLSRTKLQGASLVLADLTGAHLKRADLEGADLSHAQMPGAVLYGANFTKADLSFAAMEGADLRLAQLKNARLKGTQLAGARLIAAKFHCSDLKGVNLRGADLRGAIFYGAKFDAATDIGLSDMRFARFWQSKPPSRTALVDFRSSSGAVPDEKIVRALRQDICRLRDYSVKPGAWDTRFWMRTEKIEKCMALAKDATLQTQEEFANAVAKLDEGKPFPLGVPYNCAYLEGGMKNSGSEAWQESPENENWRNISSGYSGEPARQFDAKMLSRKLADLICTEKPYASYIAEGVTRRITERIPDMVQQAGSEQTKWLTFQGDAIAFLSIIKASKSCQGTIKNMRHNLLWQLELAVEILRQEKAGLEDEENALQRAAR